VTFATHARQAFTRLSRSLVSGGSLRDLWSYSQTMLVWLLCLFLITGVDTALVGKFDFQAVGVYGACAGATLTIAGVQQALFSPLLQVAAGHSGAGSPHLLPSLLSRATRISSLLMLCMVMPVLIFTGPLLAFWLGPTQAQGGETVLRLMLVGHFLRLVWTPYALLLLGTLKHREIMLMPIVEAVLNVAVAIAAGSRHGAVGVSMGVVAGALAGQLVTIFVSMRRTREITPRRASLITQAVIRPVACFAPAILAAALASGLPGAVGSKLGLGALLASAGLAWRWGLLAEDRTQVLHLVGSLATRIGWRSRQSGPRKSSKKEAD
jgi:O-antigen/teichoic acid export membrane protein